MEPIIERKIRNSELTIPKNKRAFLTYPAHGLVPCTLEETEDSINLIFDAQGMEAADTIRAKPKWEKLRFLINCAELFGLDAEYDFSFSLENLMVDINLIPGVLTRDAKKPDSEDFLQRYKALVGSILLPKYKYEDYLEGGRDLYKKKKLLLEITTLETLDEMKDNLMKEYRRLIWETSSTKRLVSRQTIWISRIAIPLLAVVLLASAFFGGRMLLIDIPFRDSLISANTAYINRDPLSVQRILSPYNIDRLSTETRYFLSRSYVSTAALTDMQRENILMVLTPMTSSMLFDYWIYIGRLYFEEAIELAQRMGDNEYLLYAYIQQDAFVRADMNMPGEERIQLLAELERNIDALTRARADALEEIFGGSQ